MAALATGEVLVSNFITVALNKVFTIVHQELGTFLGVNEEIDELRSTFMLIQSVLKDAEEKQTKSEAIRDWLRKLKDVGYDADDLLDEFSMKAMLAQQKLCCFCLSSSNLRNIVLHYKLGTGIKDIVKRLDKLASQRFNLGLKDLGESSGIQIVKRPETTASVDELNVFGRAGSRERIVNILISDVGLNEENLLVVPIVGMGGIGKTTLAQFVFNDKRVEKHFEKKMWFSVSPKFEIRRLIKELIEYLARGKDTNLTNLNLLQKSLQVEILDKRFLLVLDDVWEMEYNVWEQLHVPLAAGARGSRILVTTRNVNCTNIMKSIKPYHLDTLSEEDSWSLFCRFAFANENFDIHSKLEATGKKTVKKMDGLPLAIRMLGSLLYSKTDENDWKAILNSEIWELPHEENSILPALRLSYQHLPPHLKQCFSYCSIYHKGHEYERDRLVQLWMAQGFIQPQAKKRVEVIGNEYFDDLLCRSFFQILKGKYVMHDLMHDLAKFISMDECSTLECSFPPVADIKGHHFSVNYLDQEMDGFFEVSSNKPIFPRSTRTILFKYWGVKPFSHDIFFKLKCIRVLDISDSGITKLPNSIGNLRHLRYLDISENNIEMLPKSICSLYNLQTLNLEKCSRLQKLPKYLCNLTNLRHLKVDVELISTISGIGKLASLQDLMQFEVEKESRHKVVELRNMSELGGRLCILKLENVVGLQEASEAKLNEKQYLQTLELRWSKDRNGSLSDEVIEGDVLEGLQPHSNLKVLIISSYGGTRSPSWLKNQLLHNLEIIHLDDCSRWRVLPPLRQLSFLRILKITGFNEVKQICHEFYNNDEAIGFPLLEELTLQSMPKLREWVGANNLRCFPYLRILDIRNCPNFTELPAIPPTLTDLTIMNVGLRALPELLECDGSFNNTNSSSVSSSSSRPPLLSSCLSSVVIEDCPNLTSLQEGFLRHHLRALKKLIVRQCVEVVTFPAEGFKDSPFLKAFEIGPFPKLKALVVDDHVLPSAKCTNNINSPARYNDWSLFLLGLTKLGSLSCLAMIGCPVNTYFPAEVLQHLMTLEKFYIHYIDDSLVDYNYLMQQLIVTGPASLFNICSFLLGLSNLSSLSRLTISQCPVPTSFPLGMLQRLTSLEKLEIIYVDSSQLLYYRHEHKIEFRGPTGLSNTCWLLPWLQGLDPLDSMYLSCYRDLSPLSVEVLIHLTTLQELVLTNCGGLTSPIVETLTSLRSLTIERCSRLTSFHREGDTIEDGDNLKLSSLQILWIIACPPVVSLIKDDEEWLKGLTSLEKLYISHCNDLRSLPAELQNLTSLQLLDITNCGNLSSLPDELQSISSLKKLCISNCPMIKCLPKSGLPATLEILSIWGCPLLKEQCDSKKGSDWPKIAHIPRIHIR